MPGLTLAWGTQVHRCKTPINWFNKKFRPGAIWVCECKNKFIYATQWNQGEYWRKMSDITAGMRVLHENTGTAKTVADVINCLDDEECIVLFTDNTYVIVPDDHHWMIFK